MKLETGRLDPVIAPALQIAGVRHAFFCRTGGYSTGIYRGLNTGLGSNDDRRAVLRNRAIAAAYLEVPPEKLLTPFQTHTTDVIVVEAPFADERPAADAIVTATPDLAIGVQTADCGPMLFADAKAGIIAAAHAGWKGAISGVLENTVEAMIGLGAARTNIVAALGPTISQVNYEIGPELVADLIDRSPANRRFLAASANTGHALFDLAGYILMRLEIVGVRARWTGQCTYAQEDRFYSYRRKTHRDEADYGRQLSAIAFASTGE